MTQENSIFNTFLGKYHLSGQDGRICKARFTDNDTVEQEHYVHEPYIRQLREYFEGERKVFYIPLDVQSTAFQRKVWEAVQAIPYGEVATYGELARRLGN